MKKILYAKTDSGNPITSGYEHAKIWAEAEAPEGYYITSHKIGSWQNRYGEIEERYVYKVCIDEEEKNN